MNEGEIKETIKEYQEKVDRSEYFKELFESNKFKEFWEILKKKQDKYLKLINEIGSSTVTREEKVDKVFRLTERLNELQLALDLPEDMKKDGERFKAEIEKLSRTKSS